MFETMKKGFGLAVGWTAGLTAMKIVEIILCGDLKGKENKGKH